MNMKHRKLIQLISVSIFLMLLSMVINTSAAITTNKESFSIQDNAFTFSIQGSTETEWDEGKQYSIGVIITLENVSSSIVDGRITIQLVSFVLTTESIGDFRRNVVNSGESLLKPGDTTNASYTFDSPTVTQAFHVNITIILNWEINGTTSNPESYSIRLPKEGSLIVKSKNIAPLIQLYGFPDKTAFLNWLRIYGFFLSLYLVPVTTLGLLLGIQKFLERRMKKA